MKKNGIEERELIALLTKSKMERPSEDFSKRLTKLVIEQHQAELVTESPFEKHLGKFVLLFLICFNMFFFYELKLFSVEPMLFISLIAFILGAWSLIFLMGRFRKFSFSG